jgi:ADP-ribose pyrophosphatase YjhB (NUDIX family)
VKEETGLNVEIIRLAGIYSKPDKDEIVFSFECKIISGAITLNEEAKDIQYFLFDAFPKNTAPKQVERIKDLLESASDTVVMKVQTGKSTVELIKEGKL